jgi:Ca2+-binding RTX toxin-like protein
MTTFFLNPSSGSAIGGDDNDIFSTPTSSPYFYQSDWSRFVLRGGGGFDTLNLNYADIYDLTKLAEFSGVEKLSFSNHGGEVYLTSQHLAGISEISGSDMTAITGRIYLAGEALQTFDLRGKILTNNYIFKSGSSAAQYSDIVLTDKSQLLANDGNRLNFEVQSGVRVHLIGGTFTDEEKALLDRRGVTYIRDDQSSTASNAAPTISGLNGDRVQTKDLGVVALDAGANGSISDDIRVRKITVSVVNGNGNDHVTFANSPLELPNGVSEGGRIRDPGTIKSFANIYNVTNSSFEIYFNGEATQAHVDKVVRSLVYYNTGKTGETTRQIQITASDGADKTATSTVTVTHTGGVTAPVTGGRVNGTAETEVIKGSAKADMIYGGAGDDTIYGGAGKDTLRGEAGKDVFVFDTRPSKSNVDKIVSYKTRDDSIWLDNNVFTKVGRGTPENPQKLASKAFWAGDKAHDASDRIIYNKKTGALYYDQDGTGSKAAVQFATIDKNLKMNASEFFVI